MSNLSRFSILGRAGGVDGCVIPEYDSLVDMGAAITAGDLVECDVACIPDGSGGHDKYVVRDGSARSVCEGQQISSGGVSVSASDLLTDDSIVLLAPRADWPFFADYADTLPEDDWYSKAIPDVSQESIGLWYLTSEDEDLSDYLHESNPFSGIGNVFHHGTITAAAQLRGEMTFSALYLSAAYDNLNYGQWNSLGAVRGMGSAGDATENVLWELILQTRDTLRYHHESGTDVNTHVDWDIPFRLREGYINHFAFTRDASGAVTVYLDGHKLDRLTVVDNATDNGDGTATGTTAPENGSNSVNMLQRRPDYPKLKYWHVQNAARSAAEIEEEAETWASEADPNIVAAAMPIADVITALQTGTEHLFLVPDSSDPTGMQHVVGGAWDGDWDAVVTPEKMLNDVEYIGWNGTGDSVFNSAVDAQDPHFGAGDVVWRYLIMWDEPSFRARWWGCTPPGSGNWGTTLAQPASGELEILNQYGSKVSDRIIYDLVAAGLDFEKGRFYLISIAKEDQEDGTSDYRTWINGTLVDEIDSLVGAASDNGDGSYNMTDAESDSSTEISPIGHNFSDTHSSLWKAWQVDLATTTDAAELAIAEALGLA